MFKTHNKGYKCNSNDAMASWMLTHSWLKFTDTLLFTVCLITEIQTPNVKVFNPEESSPCATRHMAQQLDQQTFTGNGHRILTATFVPPIMCF
jgi:hypothetical protein